jgi:hypothetical protein
MIYTKLNKNIFDCKNCPTSCDATSKGEYIFDKDVVFSESFETKVIDFYNAKENFTAAKTTESGYPDIILNNKITNSTFFIEIKVQRRTFMLIKKHLPNSNLFPSETIALNQSDLIRYFDLKKELKKNIYILWVLQNRPCIVAQNSEKYYIQEIDNLEKIYKSQKDKRRFRRKSGDGDVIDGEHKGVVVNYHFSLNELKEIELK